MISIMKTVNYVEMFKEKEEEKEKRRRKEEEEEKKKKKKTRVYRFMLVIFRLSAISIIWSIIRRVVMTH